MRVFALLVAMLGQNIAWTIRAHLFSFLFTALCLWLIGRRRWHWLYPIIFLVWANTHAGVAFGGAIIGACVVVAARTDRSAAPRWLVIGVLCALATLINPLGVGLWQYVFGAFTDPVRALIGEWQPPRLDSLTSYPFFLLATL